MNLRATVQLRLWPLLFLFACASAQPAAAPRVHFWFAMHPGSMVEFDPVTDTVLRTIPFQHGMPWGITLTHDEQRFLVVTDQQRKIEVVDRAQGKVTEVHDFAEEGFIVRVGSVRELPGGKQWYVNVDRIKKHVDHYTFEPGEVLLYDVAEKKVAKKLKRLPEELRRQAMISPDGQSWHAFGEDGDLLILDPQTMKETGRIDLHTPLFTGQGELQLTRNDLYRGKNPNAYRMLVTMNDPVERTRSQWGIAEIDLQQRKLVELREWGPNPGSWGLRVAARKPVGCAMGGDEERNSKLTMYELVDGRKLAENTVRFRPRRHLAAIAPDGDKIYIGGAGSDLEVFDARLQPMKVIEFEGEIYGQIFVLDG